jgi:predicted nucleic acid-binding protein
MLVIDANLAFKWMWDEDNSPLAVRLLDGRALVALKFIMTELANIFWLKVNAGLIRIEGAQQRLATFQNGPVLLRPDQGVLENAFQIATEIGHSIYDCMYLALLDEVAFEFVTNDKGLIVAAKKADRFQGRVHRLKEYVGK